MLWNEGLIWNGSFEADTSLSFENSLLKQDVADILVKDFGMPELVPGEFGGTADSAQ